MNGIPPNDGRLGLLQGKMRLPDFAVCWAGPDPFGPGFCFGTEDGKLVFADEGGTPVYAPFHASRSGEAINGVAGWGKWIAVSTRQDVTVGSPFPTSDAKHIVRVLPHGAHGIRTIHGTAYRVLSSGEDLFVLTSRGLYALMKLGGQLVNGTPSSQVPTQILTIHVDAADVNLVGANWLVAVTPDGIQRFSVPSIVAMAQGKPTELAAAEMSEAQAETLTPDWERYEISEASTKLAPTG